MKITGAEIKTAANGKEYKKLTLSEKFEGKDITNVFAGTPYFKLNVGDEVDVSMLSINGKGYLELGKPQNAQPQVSNPNTGIDVKLGFIAQGMKEQKEMLTRILVHIGAGTKKEEADVTSPKTAFDDAPTDDITPDDIPF